MPSDGRSDMSPPSSRNDERDVCSARISRRCGHRLQMLLDIGHLGVIADVFPEHLALIVADVDAVDVGACVFTKNIIVLCTDRHGNNHEDI